MNTPGPFACCIRSCPFRAEIYRPWCCNGCKDSNGRWHTRNCYFALYVAERSARNEINGARQQSHPYSIVPPTVTENAVGDLVDVATRSNDLLFTVPSGWARGSDTVMDYLQWFSWRYQTEFDSRALAEWNQTESTFKAICSRQGRFQMETVRRHLQIHAYPRAALPPALQYIDVDTGIQCTTHGAGSLHHLTGCDFDVMARLTGQQSTAIALRLAMLQIEMQELQEIAFTCLGGTHRSVGCACLLAIVFYPEANLVFHTDKTRSAASLRLQAVSP